MSSIRFGLEDTKDQSIIYKRNITAIGRPTDLTDNWLWGDDTGAVGFISKKGLTQEMKNIVTVLDGPIKKIKYIDPIKTWFILGGKLINLAYYSIEHTQGWIKVALPNNDSLEDIDYGLNKNSEGKLELYLLTGGDNLFRSGSFGKTWALIKTAEQLDFKIKHIEIYNQIAIIGGILNKPNGVSSLISKDRGRTWDSLKLFDSDVLYIKYLNLYWIFIGLDLDKNQAKIPTSIRSHDLNNFDKQLLDAIPIVFSSDSKRLYGIVLTQTMQSGYIPSFLEYIDGKPASYKPLPYTEKEARNVILAT